ncbi:hypothetical protein BASA50_009261 [Batrachochytrium salamandrivorans]|uniref:MULE transposase domain-containing protein n=1 Tax=Batrachochytrium salamandrivorans TaxID=1357716 RepID=A0ABQ8F2Z7_9FUNG|nr:hypothetical protein BASA50_009261 [Batrachochytrium salamandrivorans]
MPADSATSTTGSEYLSTATVTKMAPMMTTVVTKSQIHQSPQPSAHSPNDPVRIHNAKIKEKMDSGVDIAKELDPIKNFVYDSDQFTFTACIAIDGIYDLPTKCIVVMFICTPSEEDTDELLTCFMDILGDEEAKEFYTIDH